jgi:valyl-tRNA synthetase
MLGDVAVAIHPEDERYLHLHGKKLRLPLMNREIPMILDEWVSREFGTGAVKVTPAHDPNDFALGERHHLPSINVMDDTATSIARAALMRGLDRYVARKKIVADLEEQGCWRHQGLCATTWATATAARRLWSRGSRRSGSSRFSRWPIRRLPQ